MSRFNHVPSGDTLRRDAISSCWLWERDSMTVKILPLPFAAKMKLKEIERTANVAWSPAKQHPVYLAAGTAAQQLDATFR